jgi:hypothetical protein
MKDFAPTLAAESHRLRMKLCSQGPEVDRRVEIDGLFLDLSPPAFVL